MTQIQSDRPAQIALVGRWEAHGAFFWSRKISVTVLATDDEVCFIPYDGSRAKPFSYDALHSVSSRDFLGRKTLVVHGVGGVESVRCDGSQDEVFAFCRFVNSRIAAAEKKPIGARFKLTQLEAPPDAKFTPEHPQEEYDSAIDALFDPINWTELLFDDLDKNVEFDRQHDPDRGSTQQNTQFHHSTSRLIPPKRSLPRQKNDSSPIVVQPLRGVTKQSWVIGTLAVLFLSGALWWRSDLSHEETKDVVPAAITTRPIHSVERSPAEQPTNIDSRVALRLLQIMEDDRQYAQLLEIFRKHRQAQGLTVDQINAALGWGQSELTQLETGMKQPKLIGLIDLAMAIRLDIHNAIDWVK